MGIARRSSFWSAAVAAREAAKIIKTSHAARATS